MKFVSPCKFVVSSFILLLLALSPSLGFSQDTMWVQQRQLDSILQDIKEHPGADTGRVKFLMDSARLCFYDGDFLSGLIAVNEARSISKEQNFAKGQGSCFKGMAIFIHGFDSGKGVSK